MPNPPSKFVWYDLMTTDPAAAKAFYNAVAGWETEDWNTPDGSMPYQMWAVKGVARGGMMQLPDAAVAQGARPHWMAHISCANVDATVAQAKQLGAKVVHEPTDIPTVGRFAILSDPQGAMVAIFSPSSPMSESPNGGADDSFISWHELHTTDQPKAFEFYSKLFGWEKTRGMDMGDMGTYQLFSAAGKECGAMFNSPAANPPFWMLYAKVDNADAAAKRVTDHGGKVLHGPMDVPDEGRVAQCMDPQGAMVAVHSVGQKA